MGLLGDRAYGLIDSADGKVATAKNPGKCPTLFAFYATFLEHPSSGTRVPAGKLVLGTWQSVMLVEQDDPPRTKRARDLGFVLISESKMVSGNAGD